MALSFAQASVAEVWRARVQDLHSEFLFGPSRYYSAQPRASYLGADRSLLTRWRVPTLARNEPANNFLWKPLSFSALVAFTCTVCLESGSYRERQHCLLMIFSYFVFSDAIGRRRTKFRQLPLREKRTNVEVRRITTDEQH